MVYIKYEKLKDVNIIVEPTTFTPNGKYVLAEIKEDLIYPDGHIVRKNLPTDGGSIPKEITPLLGRYSSLRLPWYADHDDKYLKIRMKKKWIKKIPMKFKADYELLRDTTITSWSHSKWTFLGGLTKNILIYLAITVGGWKSVTSKKEDKML